MLYHRVLIHYIGKGCPKAYSYAYADKGKRIQTELVLNEAEIVRPHRRSLHLQQEAKLYFDVLSQVGIVA